MLDIIIFASAVAITKYISQKNPLLCTNTVAVGSSDKNNTSSSHNALQKHANNSNNNVNNNNDAPPNRAIHQVAQSIFHACLLICLLLFALSILEAAPISWLVLIESASLFIVWYRALLWALCILLLVVHPAFLGVILGASIFTSNKLPSLFRNTKSSTTIMQSSPRNNRTEGRKQQRRHPFIICLNILWITIRFVLVTILWRLIRKIVGAIIPYRITRTDNGAVSRRNAKRKSILQCCTTVAALISLSLSFISLATVGSLVLHYDTSDESGGFLPNNSITFEEEINSSTEGVKTSIFDYISLKFMVSVICAFGMIVASILNGFGCASLPHANLVGMFLEPTPLSIISKVEDDLVYARKTLEEKHWMLMDVMQQQQQQQQQHQSLSSSPSRRSTPSSSTTSSSYNSTPSKNKLSAEKSQLKQLQEEVIFLENLVGDMTDDIEEMKQSQQLALAARTPFGRIRGILGVIFSIVLVVRVIVAANSFLSIFEGNHDANQKVKSFNSQRDPLTSISLWLLGRNIVNAEQYDLFRQATSLVLAGVLSMSQVRAFFRVVGALGRKLSRTCGMSTLPMGPCMHPLKPNTSGGLSMGDHGNGNSNNNNVALLLSSFIMGCYFLACVTVVKMNLPIEYRSSFSTAVGLNFNFNTNLLNMIFFVSACVTAVILAILFGIQRNNSDRYQLESHLGSVASSQLLP